MMKELVDSLLRGGCAFGIHNYRPWQAHEESDRLEYRQCVRCGTREYQDEDGRRVESRWVAGRDES